MASQVLTVLVVISLAVNFQATRAVPCLLNATDDPQGSQYLQCSHLRMTKLPAANTHSNLVKLDISFNYLTSLAGLAEPSFHRLRHLNVGHNQLTSLPDDVFRDVPYLQVLDLGYNPLRNMTDGVFRGLRNLTVLVLRGTGLHGLPDLLFSHTPQLSSLDLSENVLSYVPSVALRPLSRLQRLTVSNSELSVVSNHSFSALRNLRELYLDNNNLSGLQHATFTGLEKLETLDVHNNHLTLDTESYPPGVFSPLVALTRLTLRANDYGVEGEYPLNVFDPLQSLRFLSIDSFREPYFGEAFLKLTRLHTLSLENDGCHMRMITNNTFTAFRNSGLKTLYIRGCPLMHVETCAFCHMPSLTSLTIIPQRFYRLSSSLLALYGLQNQTMELVDLSYSRGIPTMLDETNTVYLNNICIKSLVVHKSNIVGVTPRALTLHGTLMRCLKHIDMSMNALKMITRSFFFKLAVGLTSIESMDLQNQLKFKRSSRGYKTSVHSDDDPGSSFGTTLYISTAASLRSFNMSAGIDELAKLPDRVHFPHGGNITLLDLSYDGAYHVKGSITGLTNIHTLDISGNDCNIMGTHLFQNMTTLRRLYLADSHLNEDFLRVHGAELLQPLEMLEELNLADNDLHTLPRYMLRYQSRLQRLNLAGNRLQEVPEDIPRQHQTLKELDLSNNMLTSLPPSLRHDLDRLADLHTFTLRLRGNPFVCTCHTLDMLTWLATTSVRLDGDVHNDGFDEDFDDNGRDYPCILEDGNRSSTGTVSAQWDSHWRRCVGLGFFTVSAVALMVQLLSVVLVYLTWSKWTYVLHAWRVLRHLRLPQRGHFLHDALFVHAEADLELVMEIRACVRASQPEYLRLRLPIEAIPVPSIYLEELAENIERSWKIVIVLTQNYLQDERAGFIVHEAERGISDSTPDRVLVLYVDQPTAHRPASHWPDTHSQDTHWPNTSTHRPNTHRSNTHRSNTHRPNTHSPDTHNPDTHSPDTVSLRRLLRMLPESCVLHVPACAAHDRQHPAWSTLAQRIAGRELWRR